MSLLHVSTLICIKIHISYQLPNILHLTFYILHFYICIFRIVKYFVKLSLGTVLFKSTCTCLAEFAVFVCLRMYFPDDDLVEFETCSRDISG
jgi:hypothetical protein